MYGEAVPPPLGPLPTFLDGVLVLFNIKRPPNALAVRELVLEEGPYFEHGLHLAVAAVVPLPRPEPHLGHRQRVRAANGVDAGLPFRSLLGGPAEVACVVGCLVGKSPHAVQLSVTELIPVERKGLALEHVECFAAQGRVEVPAHQFVFGMDGSWEAHQGHQQTQYHGSHRRCASTGSGKEF